MIMIYSWWWVETTNQQGQKGQQGQQGQPADAEEGMMQKHTVHFLTREPHHRAPFWPPRINITWRWIVNHRPCCFLRASTWCEKWQRHGPCGSMIRYDDVIGLQVKKGVIIPQDNWRNNRCPIDSGSANHQLCIVPSFFVYRFYS